MFVNQLAEREVVSQSDAMMQILVKLPLFNHDLMLMTPTPLPPAGMMLSI